MPNRLKIVVTYVRAKPFECLIILAFAAAILGLLRVHGKTRADEDWERFREDHRCQRFESDAGRSGWLCDDGKKYYRWRQQR